MTIPDLSRLMELPFEREWIFTTSRSSGPGGQNVNKVNTRVELRFNIPASDLFSDDEKEILLTKLKNKITSEGELVIVSQEERTQLKNKENVIEKFFLLISKALKPAKKRIPTQPSSASIEKRLEMKRRQAEKKMERKEPGIV